MSLLKFLGKLRGELEAGSREALLPLQERMGTLHQKAYSGFLRNPDLGVAGAGNLAQLLGSADPEAREQGRSMLGQYVQSRSPIGALQKKLLETQLTGERVRQQQEAFRTMTGAEAYQYGVSQRPTEERSSRLRDMATEAQIEASRTNSAVNRAQLQKMSGAASPAQMDRLLWEQDAGAPMPSGFRPQRRFGRTQDGQPFQFIDAQPIEGTEAYRKAEAEIRLRESMITQIDDFNDLLAESGTEFRGGKALKLRETRRRILGDYAELLRLGVLQPAEMQNLDSILPDPTSFGNQLNPWSAENIAMVYDQLRDFYAQRLNESRQANWFIESKPVNPGE